MPNGFDLHDLKVPVIVAPMAGGPSTPELAAAGSNAGGLGFVAAGYLQRRHSRRADSRRPQLTTGPLGANLFAPQPSAATSEAIAKLCRGAGPRCAALRGRAG